jgi:hypothetical protein
MQRYPVLLLGTFLSVFAVGNSSPAGAQQNGSPVSAAPSTCYAQPADLRPLGPGNYPWDSPACAAARAKWEQAHAKAIVATDAPSSSSASSAQPMTALPGGTPMSVHLTSQLSSSSAHEGDTFGFSVINDVRSAGWLVISAGAQGVGEVTNVENAGGNGHSGKVGLKFDYVYAVDGAKVRVSQTNNTTEGEQKKGAASTATIATYALIGPLGLFAHNWIKGHEASISTKTPFAIFVADTVHVQAVDHAANADDFAH